MTQWVSVRLAPSLHILLFSIQEMHDCMSMTGRIHANTGPVFLCKRIGLLVKFGEVGVRTQGKPFRLGLGQLKYSIVADLNPVWVLLQQMLDNAEALCHGDGIGVQPLMWPSTDDADVKVFADSVAGFICDSLQYSSKVEYGVLNPLRKMLHSSTAHCSEDLFDKYSLKEITAWTPDEAGYVKEINALSGKTIRRMFGINPLWFSCVVCYLASCLEASKLKKLLRADPGVVLQHAQLLHAKGGFNSPMRLANEVLSA